MVANPIFDALLKKADADNNGGGGDTTTSENTSGTKKIVDDKPTGNIDNQSASNAGTGLERSKISEETAVQPDEPAKQTARERAEDAILAMAAGLGLSTEQSKHLANSVGNLAAAGASIQNVVANEITKVTGMAPEALAAVHAMKDDLSKMLKMPGASTDFTSLNGHAYNSLAANVSANNNAGKSTEIGSPVV